MYEKILAVIGTACTIFGVLWFVCGRNSHRRTGSGTRSDARRVGDDIDRAADNNRELAEAEQRTAESIERAEAAIKRSDELIGRAGDNAERSQELIGKAKHILSTAKRTD